MTIFRGKSSIILWKLQCFGSVFIFYGSGSSDSGWRPIRIRIQSWSRALMTKKWKKITAEKKIKFFFIKNCNLPIPRSLQLTKEAIQHFKTWIFSTFVGHFGPPGSGSGSVFKLRIRIQWSDWIRIQSGSGSETLENWPKIFSSALQK